MTSVYEVVVQKLELNFKSVYIEGVKILIKILENIVNQPGSERYRKILTKKLLVKQKLLVLNGIENLFIAIGYTKNNDGNFVLPFTVSGATVQKYLDYLYNRLGYVIAFPEEERIYAETEVIPAVVDDNPVPEIEIPGRPYLEKIQFPKVLKIDNRNLQFLEKLSDDFFQYEDKELQEFTRQHIIPNEMLKGRTSEKISKIQRLKIDKLSDIEEPVFGDVFLIELLNWFNTSFFQWVDEIMCKICHRDVAKKQFMLENDIQVEYIDCCGERTCLYRYVDIAQLLKSRRGRAQEFANCFTFLCRCLDYDARYVHTDFDHAWTEVFILSQNKWIHFDPSKNIFNAPLVYEHYFKNKLTYAVAVSVDDIQNVTRRYTCHYDRVVKARTHFKETELLKTIQKIRKKRQESLSKAQKNFLKSRNATELIGLKDNRMVNEDENVGRSSGNDAWKLCRNENNVCNGHVFELNDIEIKLKQFALRYSCIQDLYERYNRITGALVKRYPNWKTCLYECENIFYKKEYDWRMVYLCRTQDCDYGRVEWKFDFTSSGLRIKEAYVKFVTKTFESGHIEVWFQHEDGNKYRTTAELRNSQKFSIIAELSGGNLSFAWQHAQLFRERFRSKDYPFEMYLQFY